MKKELLFYCAYEDFYAMAKVSDCFRRYCNAAFGEDFSQDGFSDVNQVNLILDYVPKRNDIHILDIGCGNGKMLKYLQREVGGYIYGFDFSENAIVTACADKTEKSDFKVGIIGEIEYPSQMFDIITSMDTVYFAKDMNAFIGQVYRWLKDDGIFYVAYQEGDIMAKTDNSETTVLAEALRKNSFKYEVIDYTRKTYEMLNHKRKTIITFKSEFLHENLEDWYFMILSQTDSANVAYEEYRKSNARYIYVVRK